MKALVKYKSGSDSIRLMDVPEPKPGIGEVKIAVKAASICGSDLAYMDEHALKTITPPLILGHEGSGVIVELGEGVNNFKVGDRVTSETTFSVCGTCEFCYNAEFNRCTNRKGLGSGANGWYAEYVIGRSLNVHRLPESLPFENAALTEPLSCAVHAVLERTNLKPFYNVAIFGPGPIGQLVMQIAKLSGATVIMIGTKRGASRLDLAKSLGADYTIINSSPEYTYATIQEITRGKGIDISYECSGAESAIQTSFKALKTGGTHVWMGALHKKEGLTIDYDNIFFNKELTLTGSRATTSSSWSKALALSGSGKINTDKLITHILPIEEWEHGFSLVRSKEAIKVVLKF